MNPYLSIGYEGWKLCYVVGFGMGVPGKNSSVLFGFMVD
jgi:hypothetical protein